MQHYDINTGWVPTITVPHSRIFNLIKFEPQTPTPTEFTVGRVRRRWNLYRVNKILLVNPMAGTRMFNVDQWRVTKTNLMKIMISVNKFPLSSFVIVSIFGNRPWGFIGFGWAKERWEALWILGTRATSSLVKTIVDHAGFTLYYLVWLVISLSYMRKFANSVHQFRTVCAAGKILIARYCLDCQIWETHKELW